MHLQKSSVEPSGMWEYVDGRKAFRAIVPGMSDYNCFIVVKKGAHAARTNGMTGVIQLWTGKLWLEEPYIYAYAECGDYSAWGDDPYGKFLFMTCTELRSNNLQPVNMEFSFVV